MPIPAVLLNPVFWKVAPVVLKKAFVIARVMTTKNPGTMIRLVFGVSYKTSVMINGGLAASYGIAYSGFYLNDKYNELLAKNKEKYVYKPTKVEFVFNKPKTKR